MNCREFKEWLLRKGAEEDAFPNEAVAHMECCAGCRSLCEIDSGLEEIISRKFLKEVDLPEGLADRVEFNLRCAEGCWNKARSFRPAWMLFPVAALTALLIVFAYPAKGRFQSVEELGRLAVENHLSHLAIMFIADEVDDVGAWFRGRLDFPVSMPDTRGLGLELIGGRKCRLGSNDVAYLFYSNGRTRGRSSIFIIDPHDLGFHVEDGKTYNVNVRGRKVRFWKEGDAAYLMVE